MTSTVDKMKVWGADVLERSVRTGAQVFAAYLTVVMQVGGPPLDWAAGLTHVGFAIVLSLLTSAIAMPSFGEQWYFQLAERAVKTFMQTMVAGIGTATMFAEVDWATVFEASWVAALYSIVTSVATTRVGEFKNQVNLTAPASGARAIIANERTGSGGY